MEDKLALKQLIEEIQKAIPEINPQWLEVHLRENINCDFRNDPNEIQLWVEHFKALWPPTIRLL